jgi:hypothetical protein
VGSDHFCIWVLMISSTGGCCSGGTPVSRGSQVPSGEFRLGSYGVTFASGPGSTKSVEKVLVLAGLRRSRTKTTIPMTARMAPAPARMPPTIAPMFRFPCGVGILVPVAVAFIVSTGAFRANGANTAPCAGLAAPWRVESLTRRRYHNTKETLQV